MRFSCLLFLAATFCVGGFAGDDGTGLVAGAQIVPRVRPLGTVANALLPKADIRSDTDIVLVPVTVIDTLNRFVGGLNKDSFEIYEDKTPQKIVSFGCDDAPISLGDWFRHQRQYGAKTGTLANGGSGISEVGQSAGRGVSGGIQRPAGADRASYG